MQKLLKKLFISMMKYTLYRIYSNQWQGAFTSTTTVSAGNVKSLDVDEILKLVGVDGPVFIVESDNGIPSMKLIHIKFNGPIFHLPITAFSFTWTITPAMTLHQAVSLTAM